MIWFCQNLVVKDYAAIYFSTLPRNRLTDFLESAFLYKLLFEMLFGWGEVIVIGSASACSAKGIVVAKWLESQSSYLISLFGR